MPVTSIEKLIEMRKSGKTMQEIADAVGVSRQRVAARLAKAECTQKFYKTDQQARQEIAEAKRLSKYGSKNKPSDIERRMNFCIARVRYRAEREGIPFNIKLKDFLPLPSRCPVLDITLDYFPSNAGNRNNWVSFDRIDPSKGYVIGNVRILSYGANRKKKQMIVSDEELRKLCGY